MVVALAAGAGPFALVQVELPGSLFFFAASSGTSFAVGQKHFAAAVAAGRAIGSFGSKDAP